MTPVAVFDCMVFVQALANKKGPACACYDLVRSGRLALHISTEILAEVSDVLSRPKVRRKLPALTDEAVEAFLRDVLGRAVMHSEVPEVVQAWTVTLRTSVTSIWLWLPKQPISLRGTETFSI